MAKPIQLAPKDRKCPLAKIIVRGDSGFCRDELMDWCELRKVDYLFGLAKNSRLEAIIASELLEAAQEYEQKKEPSRRFKDFRYRTLNSWTRERRVVGKAEVLAKGANPRFVVTSLLEEDFDAPSLYEQEYCGRGQMENEIKQYQTDMFGERLSAHDFEMNQLRLFFSAFAYILMTTFRRVALKGTELERAYLGTIRLRLLKIGGIISVSVRRVYVKLSSSFPLQDIFTLAWRRLNEGPS